LTKTPHKKQPIGVFDSGIGGLTVANAINRHLPNEEIIYFGDTAHLPYGDKSADAIRYYCLKIVKFLLERDCKMIVIACNSASSAAYNVLVDFFPGEAIFVNVIDPLIEAVVKKDFSKVGIIATKATIRSDVYQRKLREKQPNLQVAALETPLLVPMIEEGYFDNKISQVVIETYLSNEQFKGIEALLLACTHYPLIRPDIEGFLGPGVKVLDSTLFTVKDIENRLRKRDLLNDEKRNGHQFYVSDYTQSFEETTRLFYNEHLQLDHFAIW
jgi:glutamate racemase